MVKKTDYPREIAIKILYKINHEGAYSNIALHDFLNNNRLDSKDKAFVHQLVYGVVKNVSYLDWIISKYSKIKIKKISPWIKEILRLAIYQIFFLHRVPDFAAVDESVQLSKKYSKGKSHGFVNGVLRNIIRDKDKIINYNFSNNQVLMLLYSFPQWLTSYLLEQYSYEEVKNFFENSMESAPVSIRVNTLKTTKDQLRLRLNKEGIKSSECYLYPEALILEEYDNITLYESFKEGLFMVQDEAAMLTVDILDPKPQEKILDMCSAPGGKTTHIGERLKGQKGLISRDIYDHKINLIQSNCSRLGLNNIIIEKKDGMIFYEEDRERFNRILLDAPCSGLGIIRRKPDIKLKLKYDDIQDIIKTQKKLIENAFLYLKNNGILVYSTCTINKYENEDVVSFLINKYPNAEIIPPDKKFKSIMYKDKYIQTIPDTGKCDGFFICKIKKTEV